jgi:hypothetical protein
MRRRLKVNTAMNGLAVLMLSGALSAGSPAGALADAGSPGTGSQVCQSVIVKVRATHWVWLKETRKIHGRRVFVRRHGKIVRRHVRVSYFRAEPERLCTVTTLAALTPPSPVTPPAPTPVAPAPPEVVPPANTGLPTISGTARAGQTLTAGLGSWSNSPTSYAYQWLRCNSAGTSCAGLSGATSSTYGLVEADVGSTLKVSVIASNAGGSSAPANSAQTAVVTSQPPSNSSAPTIAGNATTGQTLTAGPGTWSGAASYAYQWQRCDSSGGNCSAISGETTPTYKVGSPDLDSTLRVAVSASNSAGSSTPVSSTQTEVVPLESVTTFGKTSVGSGADKFGADFKRVNAYPLATGASVSKLSIYLQPSGTEGQQAIKGVLYADSAGKPGALLGVSKELLYHSSEAGAWHDLVFATAVKLAAGSYWLGVITGATSKVAGFRFDSVGGSRDLNANVFTAPSNPFGVPSTDPEQMSIYATYTSSAPPSHPVNSAAPTVSGVAETEQKLTASPGSWSEGPTSHTYQWQRCSSTGEACAAISGATAPSYTLASADLGHTLRVSVVANNVAGASAPASSTATPLVISSSGAHHLEYVFNVGLVSVYDIDQGLKSVGTISLPQTLAGIRGVMVSPGTHMMYIAYGGDSGGNGSGSVLAYDLEADQVVWDVHLNTGIDSGAVSADGQLLYMPTGEGSEGTTWNILSTANGELVGTITGGFAPHNTIASKDGQYVYLGARYSEFLSVYNTTTHKVSKVGPLIKGVRPFTVNGSNTVAFTTATEFDGFQVSSLTKGTVLSTIPFQSAKELQEQKEKEEQEEKEGKEPVKFPDSGYSHGISLSPNEKELYVVDAIHKEVRAYSVPKIAELEGGVAPTLITEIALPAEQLKGTENPCAYDCGRGGWLQRSTDGRFVFVGDSGAVIDTTKREIVATLPTLLNTKISLEIDWENGAPTVTSGRTGVGEVP